MKRRNFLQWCLGVLGVGTTSLPETEGKIEPIPTHPPKLGDAYYSPKLNKRSGYTKGEVNVMDFSPDKVIGIDKFKGRCIVYCEHSVWELEENYQGGLQRKLLLHESDKT